MAASRFILIICLISLFLPIRGFAQPREWTENDFKGFVAGVLDKIDARVKVNVADPGGLRALDLRERSMERELQDVERRVRTIEAMLGRSQDQYAVTKEYIYKDADILLFGCFVNRAVVAAVPGKFTLPLERDLDARSTSVLCGVIDAATILIPLRFARLNPTLKTVVDDAFSSRKVSVSRGDGKVVRTMDAHRYPRSVGLLRAAVWSVAGFMALEQTLAWTYADEIDYRRSIGKLQPSEVTLEIQRQLKIANDLNLELAAVRAAKAQVRQSIAEGNTGG